MEADILADLILGARDLKHLQDLINQEFQIEEENEEKRKEDLNEIMEWGRPG